MKQYKCSTTLKVTKAPEGCNGTMFTQSSGNCKFASQVMPQPSIGRCLETPQKESKGMTYSHCHIKQRVTSQPRMSMSLNKEKGQIQSFPQSVLCRSLMLCKKKYKKNIVVGQHRVPWRKHMIAFTLPGWQLSPAWESALTDRWVGIGYDQILPKGILNVVLKRTYFMSHNKDM